MITVENLLNTSGTTYTKVKSSRNGDCFVEGAADNLLVLLAGDVLSAVVD